ncbi:MAG: hypothetical protein ACPH8C_00540 [Candidatus Puniceispirillaceae bacterium]
MKIPIMVNNNIASIIIIDACSAGDSDVNLAITPMPGFVGSSND